MKKQILFFILGLTLIEGFAQSPTNYYVSATSPGNDNNNGLTLLTPFRTIAKAILTATVPGDTILIKAGTYFPLNSLTFNAVSGTPAARITMRSFKTDSVFIKGDSLQVADKAIITFTNAASYITIQGLNVSSPANSYNSGILITKNCHHINISKNVVHDNKTNGISMRGTGINFINVTNNLVFNNYDSGIELMGVNSINDNYDIVISNNVIHHSALNNLAHTPGSIWGAGIATFCSKRVLISNNLVYNNQGEGIITMVTDRCTATKNVIYDNYSQSLYLDNITNSRYEGNFVYSTGNPLYVCTYDSLISSSLAMANETYYDKVSIAPDSIHVFNYLNSDTIINNIIIGGQTVFYYGEYMQGGCLKNFVVANNTFYGGKVATLHISNDLTCSPINNLFVNNIFYRGSANKFIVSPGNAGLNFHHNCWFGGAAGVLVGTGDVNSNPLFVSPGTFQATDYQLMTNSPCIDTGFTIAGVLKDFNGTPRPIGNKYDIGAYEYQSLAGIFDASIPENKFNIYPNPSGKILTFQLLAASPGKTFHILIYDSYGKIIYSEDVLRDNTNSKKEIDISSYVMGMYFIKTDFGTKKFVKE